MKSAVQFVYMVWRVLTWRNFFCTEGYEFVSSNETRITEDLPKKNLFIFHEFDILYHNIESLRIYRKCEQIFEIKHSGHFTSVMEDDVRLIIH